MIRALIVALTTLAALVPTAGSTHEPSTAYLSLETSGSTVEGRFDIALRDLEQALGLDRDGDGAITWAELRSRHGDIAAYALARLQIEADGQACPSRATGHQVDRHGGANHAVLRFTAACPAAIGGLELTYGLLFDLDRQHRGLLQVRHGGRTESAVLGPDRPHHRSGPDGSAAWQQALTYGHEGVRHIWLGFDHLLFLLTLLLPLVVRMGAGPSAGSDGALDHGPGSRWPLVVETVKVVSAFTLAHSITLALAVLGWIALPANLVESLIAASIVVAALNGLYPLVPGRLWALAFGFGLIHGLGFAGALGELGLPAGALAVSLLAFNLGVEVGQLAIVALFLPVALALCALRPPQLVWRLGSLAIALVGAIWLIERSLGIPAITNL